MKRTIKIVLIIIGSLLVCYATYFIFDAVAYAYTLDWTNTPQKYLWFFRDSAKNKIDTNFRFSYIQKHDIYNHYIYDSKFYITIWEFKDLKNINLEKIPINLDKNLNNIVFGSGETINVGAIPEVTVKYGFNFHNSMNVNIGEGGIIDSSFKFNNYRGFYGSIHKMLLSNNQQQPLILFNYTHNQAYTLFILCMIHQNFYILMVDSVEPFDAKKLIKIFNFS